MSPEISVIVPTFNRPGLLSEALKSVFAQETEALEVIVVDDSPDCSARSEVQTFTDHRLRYIENPNPSGGFPGGVRNLGASVATGRFLHFLDDDDHVPAGLYKDIIRLFDANPGVGVLFGRVQPFGPDPKEIAREIEFFNYTARTATLLQRFGKRWPIACHMTFRCTLLVCGAGVIRRECFVGAGTFDTDLRYGEDAGFYARAIRKYGGLFIDRPFLEYRIWPHTLAHSPDLAQKTIDDAFKKVQARYLREAGRIDYALSKLAARTILRGL
jgi:glycosyltransferase involved in cell wall biosynthesis